MMLRFRLTLVLAAFLVAMAPAARAAAPDPAVVDPSVVRSAERATTFKIFTVITNMTVLSAATGSLVGGGVLTALTTATSFTVYTINDYMWDKYAPATASENGSFDAGQSFWRNTGKFLTYKPVVASIKYGVIYLWTGSLAVTLSFGTAVVLTNTIGFYANNMAWDLYEWYYPRPAATIAAK